MEDDAEVKEYLLLRDLLRTRSRSVAFQGMGVSKKDLKIAEKVEEMKRKAEDKMDRIRAACDAKIENLNLHFSTVIHNFVVKLQFSNLQAHFEDFNPFLGCPGYDASLYDDASSDDNSFAPDDEPSSENESLIDSSYCDDDVTSSDEED